MSRTNRHTIDLAPGLKMFLQDVLTFLQSIEKLLALFDVRFASESFRKNVSEGIHLLAKKMIRTLQPPQPLLCPDHAH